MPAASSLERLLDRLEVAKRQFGMPEQSGIPGLLDGLDRRHFTDAGSLIRFHEALLFFRAYPPSEEVRRLTDRLLGSFGDRVERFAREGGDLEPFEEPDVSGIAGTAFSAIFSYDVGRWLAARHRTRTEIDWDAAEPELLTPLLKRLDPMFEEDAMVEANIPHREWFRAAKRGVAGSDLGWLFDNIGNIPAAADLYEHARIPIRWNLGSSRTARGNLRLPGRRRMFYHDGALLRRSDVSLAAELEQPPLHLEKLSRAQGEQFLELTRETSAMRYRELQGFTYGDPSHVLHAELGRGVEVFVSGVPPEHRLPLRAYHAGMFFKNTVPIGYIETLSFFERIEVGFNLYYTFREGETAWLYARLLHLFRQILNVKSFAVDPYQLGLHNQEAIDSGAFWFYRKLGFRPANPRVAKLLEAEETKLRSDPRYRTPARTLERLAAGWMLYELPGVRKGDWDHFEIRRVAMALRRAPFPARIARAKRGPLESDYIRLLQRDSNLRRTLLRLGSRAKNA